MMQKTFTQVLLAFFLFSNTLFAQGWQRQVSSGWRDIIVASDGNFVTAGTSISKLDTLGHQLWSYGIFAPDSVGMEFLSVKETPDQSFIASGSMLFKDENQISSPYAHGELLVVKVDDSGEELWKRVIPIDTTLNRDYGYDLELADDGSIFIAGTYYSHDGAIQLPNPFLIKLDENGNELWLKTFDFGPDVWLVECKRIVANPDETYTVLVDLNTNIGSESGLVKVDPDGNIIWQRQYPFSDDDFYFDSGGFCRSPNGGYIIGGARRFDSTSQMDIFVAYIDEAGDLEWIKSYESPGHDRLMDVEIGHDSSIILTGSLGGSVLGGEDVVFKKLDQQGNEIWSRVYGGIGRDLGTTLTPTPEGGYAVLGHKGKYGFLLNTFSVIIETYLWKTDSLGLINTSKLTGHIFDDFDLDCDYNGEEGQVNWLVEATGNGETYYGIADSTGFYCLPLDTGSYELRVITSSPYWEACEDSLSVTLEPYDTLTVDFAAQAAIDCPYLEVDISTTQLRRCFENVYHVNYCNQGTAPAEDAYVEVTLDAYLDYISSSIPPTSQQDNLFTFDIGTVEPGDCGHFIIDVIVNCDSTEIGQTHCSEARIFPNEICLDTPDWSGASIELDASCDGDSITFTITNVGTAPTSGSINYLVIEDQVILLQDDTQLDVGENKMISIAATGGTFRLESDQEPNHPGNDMPSISVEGCGVEDGTFSMGFVTQFPENDGDPFVSIDCRQNVGSWDPNDKQAFPGGVGEDHLIEPNTDLEYFIRFQNTGTDTAFNIVVRDPISEHLDLTSLRMGASSHPYRYEIQEDRTLTVYFDDIMLPDSNINEPASHGFFKFKIKQLRDLPLGLEINNTAYIYFDFNEPVITNQVAHKLGVDFLEIDLIENPVVIHSAKVYPNPFAESATIEVPGAEEQLLEFHLLDISGRSIRKTQHTGPVFDFHRKELPRGFYLYQIEMNDRVINSGKVVIQ